MTRHLTQRLDLALLNWTRRLHKALQDPAATPRVIATRRSGIATLDITICSGESLRYLAELDTAATYDSTGLNKAATCDHTALDRTKRQNLTGQNRTERHD